MTQAPLIKTTNFNFKITLVLKTNIEFSAILHLDYTIWKFSKSSKLQTDRQQIDGKNNKAFVR